MPAEGEDGDAAMGQVNELTEVDGVTTEGVKGVEHEEENHPKK